MQIHKEFGQNGSAVPFSIKALLELSKSSDPKEDLEEASDRKEKGESIPAKQTKELTSLHKQRNVHGAILRHEIAGYPGL